MTSSNGAISWATIPNSREITVVEIKSPITHQKRNGNKFTDFEISLKSNSKAFTLARSTVRRRYSDFVWLRNWLQENNEGFSSIRKTPTLPPKKIIGRFEDDFIEERMRGLQRFLRKVIEHNVFLSDKALHLFLQSNLNVKQIESYLIGEPLEMDVEYQRTERSSSDERNSQDAKRSNQTEPNNSGSVHQSTKTRTDNNSTLKKKNEDDLGSAKSERLSGLDESVENTDKGKGFVYESFNQIESENCSGSSAGSSSFVICPDEVITGGSTDGSQHVSSLESSLGSIVCKSPACDQSCESTPCVAVENELVCDRSLEITDSLTNADVVIPGASHNERIYEVSSSRHQAESGAENCDKLSCNQSSEVDLKVAADVPHNVSQSEAANQDTSRCENSIEIDEQMSNDHSSESFDKSSPHHELSDVTTQADANLQDSGFVGQSPISSTFYEPTDLNTLVEDVTIADNINSNVTQNASNISSGMQFDVLPGEENSKISMIAAEDSQLEERDKTAYTNSESSSIQK